MQTFLAPCHHLNHRRGAAGVLVLIVGILLMSFFTAVLTPPDLLQPDSPAYLSGSLLRTPGYPAFLAVVRLFDPRFASLPYLQMAALVVSAALLAEACHCLFPSAFVWLLAGTAVLANPFLWRYAWSITTESLFISFGMLLLACVAIVLRRPSVSHRWLLAASMALAAMIMVRPVAYALLMAVVVCALFWWRPVIKVLAALIGPALICVLSVSLWNLATRGVFATQVFTGYALVGHVSFLIRAQPDSPYNAQMAPIAAELKPVADHLPTGLMNWSRYFWVTGEGVGTAAYTIIMPALKASVLAKAAADNTILSEDQVIQRVDALAEDIALTTIRRDPLAYAWHVAVNFLALWTLPTITSTSDARDVVAMLCTKEFEGFYCKSGHPTAVIMSIPKVAAIAKNVLFVLLMLASLGLATTALVRGQRAPLLALVGFAALSINAHHGLVALTNVGLPRYAMAMWPYLCVMTAGALLIGLSHYRRLSVAPISGP
jgi:hypothetical protein